MILAISRTALTEPGQKWAGQHERGWFQMAATSAGRASRRQRQQRQPQRQRRLHPNPWAAEAPGNAAAFAPATLPLDVASPLVGRRIAFLGSSITYGAAALGVSFVDYLQTGAGVIATKLAVSGTTLAGPSADSYWARLQHELPLDQPLDLFVCQLSTNDIGQGKALGQITPTSQRRDFATTTTLGAIEAICGYVEDHWHCQVVFYTCVITGAEPRYQQLISELYHLQAKWQFAVIDLRNDPTVTAWTHAQPLAMYDGIHPTQLGYRQLWTPIFQADLAAILAAPPASGEQAPASLTALPTPAMPPFPPAPQSPGPTLALHWPQQAMP